MVGLTHLAKGARERSPYQHTSLTSPQNNESTHGNVMGNAAKQTSHVSVIAGMGQSQSQEITVLASHAVIHTHNHDTLRRNTPSNFNLSNNPPADGTSSSLPLLLTIFPLIHPSTPPPLHNPLPAYP